MDYGYALWLCTVAMHCEHRWLCTVNIVGYALWYIASSGSNIKITHILVILPFLISVYADQVTYTCRSTYTTRLHLLLSPLYPSHLLSSSSFTSLSLIPLSFINVFIYFSFSYTPFINYRFHHLLLSHLYPSHVLTSSSFTSLSLIPLSFINVFLPLHTRLLSIILCM